MDQNHFAVYFVADIAQRERRLLRQCDLQREIPFVRSCCSSLFVVALAGILLFRERIGPYGLFGVLLGIAALVMLSVA